MALVFLTATARRWDVQVHTIKDLIDAWNSQQPAVIPSSHSYYQNKKVISHDSPEVNPHYHLCCNPYGRSMGHPQWKGERWTSELIHMSISLKRKIYFSPSSTSSPLSPVDLTKQYCLCYIAVSFSFPSNPPRRLSFNSAYYYHSECSVSPPAVESSRATHDFSCQDQLEIKAFLLTPRIFFQLLSAPLIFCQLRLALQSWWNSKPRVIIVISSQ